MPKRQPLQITFEGGVASPLVYGRSDLPGYAKSMKSAQNMIPDSRGPVLSRFGFEFNSNVGDPADKYGRLFTFRVSYTVTFVIIITETFVWITDEDGLVTSTSKIANGNFFNGSLGWSVGVGPNGSVTFPENRCRLNSGTGTGAIGADQYAFVEQQVTGLVPGDTYLLSVNSTPISTNPNDFMIINVGTTQGGSEIASRSFRAPLNVGLQLEINDIDIWIQVRIISTPGVNNDWPEPSDVLFANVRDVNLISLVNLVEDPDPGFVSFPSPWTEDQIHDIQAEMAPDLQRMYFTHREVPVQQLDLDISLTPAVWTFTESTFSWGGGQGEDPWEEEFPGAITFFQSRLYLAATVDRPVTIWASKPGRDNYNNFDDDPGENPDDPIRVILSRNADIQWMQGSKVLYVGCDNSEHIVTSDGPAVIVSDIETQQQSAYGSARIKVDWVSNAIAFTSWDQRRMRIINYDSNTRNIESTDLTFPSEHLTIGLITEMHHAPHPINRIWTPLADGTFLSLTFERDRQISAWAPHNSRGLIKSMTITEEQGHSIVWGLSLRNGQLHLLRMTRNTVFMDEYVERSYANPTNVVGGLSHLEGEIVQVVGDGNLYPSETVVGGEITADGPAASDWTVGLQYIRSLETMPVDEVSGSQSSIASMKGWNRIYVRVLASALPAINNRRPPDRTPSSLMDTREPNQSQDIIVQNVGWDYEGTIVISQDLPFNLTVTGVYGELSEENL